MGRHARQGPDVESPADARVQATQSPGDSGVQRSLGGGFGGIGGKDIRGCADGAPTPKTVIGLAIGEGHHERIPATEDGVFGAALTPARRRAEGAGGVLVQGKLCVSVAESIGQGSAGGGISLQEFFQLGVRAAAVLGGAEEADIAADTGSRRVAVNGGDRVQVILRPVQEPVAPPDIVLIGEPGLDHGVFQALEPRETLKLIVPCRGGVACGLKGCIRGGKGRDDEGGAGISAIVGGVPRVHPEENPPQEVVVVM